MTSAVGGKYDFAEPLTKAQFEALCRDLTQEFTQTLMNRPEFARTDLLTTVLMRMHECVAANLPQELRERLSFEIAAYAGDLMAPPEPLIPYTTH